MKFLVRALVRTSTLVALPGLMLLGCISLDKPADVQKYCPNGSATTCRNNYVPPPDLDASADVNVGQDTTDSRLADEPVAAKKDTSVPDVFVDPDGPTDEPDTATVNKDVGGVDVRDAGAPDLVDAPSPRDAVPEAKVSGAEPGPEPQGAEPGAEPGSGPEPGAEPNSGPEPGAEPSSGPEPGAEPGPEPGPEPPRDGSVPDGPSAACANATPITITSGTGANTGNFGTTSAYCFVTCDNITTGWGCDNFNDTRRTVTVNGTSVTCGGTLPAKKSGYYYFAIGPGGETWDAIHWSGSAAASCTRPADGFAP